MVKKRLWLQPIRLQEIRNTTRHAQIENISEAFENVLK